MKVHNTSIKDVFLIEESVFEDDRGYFLQVWDELRYSDKKTLSSSNMNSDFSLTNTIFVQDNVSKSRKGVFRGMHYQVGDYKQAKLVRALHGSVVDFIIDLREDSDTYGKFDYFELNSKNNLSLFVPGEFAHGFLSLEDNTLFHYKCGNYYNKESEGSITPLDPIVRHTKENTTSISDVLDFFLPKEELIFSEKDTDSPKFMDRRI